MSSAKEELRDRCWHIKDMKKGCFCLRCLQESYEHGYADCLQEIKKQVLE